jgi:hypothetical protein
MKKYSETLALELDANLTGTTLKVVKNWETERLVWVNKFIKVGGENILYKVIAHDRSHKEYDIFELELAPE